MIDPLAGQRQAINENKALQLLWPDPTGEEKYPVKLGDIFYLRSCSIEITKLERIRRKDGQRCMRAAFARYPKASRPEYLARRGGLTADRKQAMPLQDQPEPGTLAVIRNEDRNPKARAEHEALGEPAEAAVPEDEIGDLRGSRKARQLYAREMTEGRLREASAPLTTRLERMLDLADERHIDVSGILNVIEKQVAKGECRVSERKVAA